MATEHKAGALQALAALADDIEGDIRTQLGPIAMSLAEDARPTKTFWGAPGASIRGDAAHSAIALGAIDAEKTAEHLLRLSAGTRQDRLWAARIADRASRPEYLWLLITLSHDPEPLVRANAAAAIATLVAADKGGMIAAAALQRCLADPGTYVPRGIAEALTEAPTLTPTAQDALATLHDHPSAQVRTASYRARPAAIYALHEHRNS